MKLVVVNLLSLGVVLITFLRKTVQMLGPLWKGSGDPSAPADLKASLCN